MTQPFTTDRVQTDLVTQAAELLIINRADEVTINMDALTVARVVTGSPTTTAPRSAREMIHTALADARTQLLRAERDRKTDGLSLLQQLFS